MIRVLRRSHPKRLDWTGLQHPPVTMIRLLTLEEQTLEKEAGKKQPLSLSIFTDTFKDLWDEIRGVRKQAVASVRLNIYLPRVPKVILNGEWQWDEGILG